MPKHQPLCADVAKKVLWKLKQGRNEVQVVESHVILREGAIKISHVREYIVDNHAGFGIAAEDVKANLPLSARLNAI